MGEIKVLWCADPVAVFGRKMPGVQLHRPAVLFTGACSDAVESFFDLQPWARSLPLFSWHPVDGPAWADRSSLRGLARTAHANVRTLSFQAPGDGFFNVTGPFPQGSRLRWWETSSRPEAVIASAFDLALSLGGPDAWEVGGDTGGLLALGAAIVGKRAVVVDPGHPGPLTMAAANRHGIALRVIE